VTVSDRVEVENEMMIIYGPSKLFLSFTYPFLLISMLFSFTISLFLSFILALKIKW